MASFIATITLYPTSSGGRSAPVWHEPYRPTCKFDPKDFTAWGCDVVLRGESVSLGEPKDFELVFVTREAGTLFQSVAKFYLCEGQKVIGEAVAKEKPRAIKHSAPLVDGTGRVVLFEERIGPDAKQDENLACYNTNGRMRWRAKLPPDAGYFVSVQTAGNSITAYLDSGYVVWIDQLTGETLRMVFTK